MRTLVVSITLFFAIAYPAQEHMWMLPASNNVHWNGIVCDNEGNVYAYGTSGLATHDVTLSSVIVAKYLKEGMPAAVVELKHLPFFDLKMIHGPDNRFYFTAKFNGTFSHNGKTYAPLGGFDAVVGAMTENGEVSWITPISSTLNDDLPGLCFNEDHSILLVTGSIGDDLYLSGSCAAQSNETSLFVGEISLDGTPGAFTLLNPVPGENGFSGGLELCAYDGDILLLARREGAPWTDPNPAQPYAGHYVYRMTPDFIVKWERLLIGGSCYYGHDAGTMRLWKGNIVVNTYCASKYGGTASMRCVKPADGSTLWSREKSDGHFKDGCTDAQNYWMVTTDDANYCPCPSNFNGYDVIREIDHLATERVVLKAERGTFRFIASNGQGMKFVFGYARDTAIVRGNLLVNTCFMIGMGEPGNRASAIPEPPSSELRIFPNPTEGKIIISRVDVSEITLIDIHGSIIHLSGTRGPTGFAVDLSAQKPGAYILVIRWNNAATERRKVVVQR
jgi:hypothetical protein